jgi:hypothetical protein
MRDGFITLFTSAARAAAQDFNSNEHDSGGYRGIMLLLDVTATGGVASVTPKLQAFDRVSKKWFTVWTAAAAVAATGQRAYLIYPSGNAAAGYTEAIVGVLPETFRVITTHGNAVSATYSIGAALLR